MYDNRMITYLDIDIYAWKESDINQKNHENFEAYYLIELNISHYDGDRKVKIKFNNKYKVQDYIKLVLSSEGNNFALDGKLYCNEDFLKVVDKNAKIIDPKIEAEKRKKFKEDWGDFFD